MSRGLPPVGVTTDAGNLRAPIRILLPMLKVHHIDSVAWFCIRLANLALRLSASFVQNLHKAIFILWAVA